MEATLDTVDCLDLCDENLMYKKQKASYAVHTPRPDHAGEQIKKASQQINVDSTACPV